MEERTEQQTRSSGASLAGRRKEVEDLYGRVYCYSIDVIKRGLVDVAEAPILHGDRQVDLRVADATAAFCCTVLGIRPPLDGEGRGIAVGRAQVWSPPVAQVTSAYKAGLARVHPDRIGTASDPAPGEVRLAAGILRSLIGKAAQILGGQGDEGGPNHVGRGEWPMPLLAGLGCWAQYPGMSPVPTDGGRGTAIYSHRAERRKARATEQRQRTEAGAEGRARGGRGGSGGARRTAGTASGLGANSESAPETQERRASWREEDAWLWEEPAQHAHQAVERSSNREAAETSTAGATAGALCVGHRRAEEAAVALQLAAPGGPTSDAAARRAEARRTEAEAPERATPDEAAPAANAEADQAERRVPPVEEGPEEEEEAEQAPNMPWEEADADVEEDQSWDAIDAIHPLLCAVSPFAQLQDVPATLVNEWVHTQDTVFERACRAHRSGNQADLDRALKWFLVLPQVLLRAPSRGGRRGGTAGEVEARFRAWRQGEHGTILRWWKAHRQKERQRNATKKAMGAPDEAHLVDRALELLEQGQISLAMNMLHSTGLGDLRVTAILDQLVGKHPRRKMPVSHELDDEELGPGLHNLEMAEQFRKLKRMKAAGIGGGRNEYLKPLAYDFEDRGLDRLRQHTNEFATFFARGEFPEWFYFLEGATRVVAPIKPAPGGLRAQQPQVPDVRPVGIGDCFRRAVCSAAAAQCKEAAAEYLSPQQVAVGVPSGISVLVHAVRLALEANPGQVVVKCDLKNAFNEVQRATMIDRVLHSPVKAIAPLLHALYKHNTHIYINKNGGRLRGGAEGDSQEGAQQGCALAAMAFCIAIHPEVLRLDERLRETGGFVICDMDDVYAVGAPDTVFQAVAGFAEDVRAIGLELVPRKSICYSPRLREQLEVDPHRLQHLSACTVGRAGTDQEEAAYGMVVAGVPVGDAAFVAQHMDGVTGGIVSKVKKTVSMLQHRSPQALHTLIFYCIQPLLVFWLQHLPPQQVLPYAERVDEAVLEAFAAAVGASTEDLQEPLTTRRVRLPARWYGCGIRSMVEQATPAYAATTAGTLPRLADRQVDGRLLKGLCPPLTQWLGRGAFDEGAERTRFSHFLGTNSATAAALGESWRQMQAVVGEVAEGPLSAPVEAAGAHTAGERCTKLQKALTAQLEQARYSQLEEGIMGLPVRDNRRVAFLNIDRFSTQWVAAWPSRSWALEGREFREGVTKYLALPSPACAPYVGRALKNYPHPVDAYGHNITSAPMDRLWDVQHDSLAYRLLNDLQQLGERVDWAPKRIFAHLIAPQHGGRRGGAKNIVPDLRMWLPIDGPEREVLYDLKTVHVGASVYMNAHLRGRGRCLSAKARADRVPLEYRKHADEIDVHNRNADFHPPGVPRWDGTPPGPVRRLLDSFPPVRGLCVGAFSEASPAVDQLLQAVAERASITTWRELGARTPKEAKAHYVASLRRNLGVSAMRENARLVLYRVEALRAPLGAAGREQVDKNEWQRSSYVRTAVAYDALSGAGTQRGGSQGWRTTCRFSCVPIGRTVAAMG